MFRRLVNSCTTLNVVISLLYYVAEKSKSSFGFSYGDKVTKQTSKWFLDIFLTYHGWLIAYSLIIFLISIIYCWYIVKHSYYYDIKSKIICAGINVLALCLLFKGVLF